MATLPVKFTATILGEYQVTKLEKILSFTLDEKIEKSIKLNNSEEVIDYSFIDNPKIFYFEGTGAFQVVLTMTLDVPDQVIPGEFVSASVEVPIDVQDVFCLTSVSGLLANVTALKIKEINAVEKTITVRIYGEAVVA